MAQHVITETQFPGAQRITIATTHNFAHAYGIAQAMSEKYRDFTYAAINVNVNRVVQYKAGRVISDEIAEQTEED